jgi:Flp pilus assembly pilin Flp
MLTGEQNQRGNSLGFVKLKEALTKRVRRTESMNYLNKMIVKARESKKGQTMTEYVLIIAAIAIAGYTAYVGLEGGINTIISNVTTTLKAA